MYLERSKNYYQNLLDKVDKDLATKYNSWLRYDSSTLDFSDELIIPPFGFVSQDRETVSNFEVLEVAKSNQVDVVWLNGCLDGGVAFESYQDDRGKVHGHFTYAASETGFVTRLTGNKIENLFQEVDYINSILSSYPYNQVCEIVGYSAHFSKSVNRYAPDCDRMMIVMSDCCRS